MELLNAAATAAGLGWASGMRLYATVFALGLLQYFRVYELPPGLEVLAHPAVIAVSGLLFCLEFFADKLPGVDSLWDAVQTFVRVPAGALLAAGALATHDPGLALAGGLLGGTVAAGTHFAKAGSRALINTSPEPFSNWIASFSEDFLSLSGLFLAVTHPVWFLLILALVFAAALCLLPRVWRGVQRVFVTIRRLLDRPSHDKNG